MKKIDLNVLLQNFTDYFKKIYKKDCYVIGIQSGGNLLVNHLKKETKLKECGHINISHHRDDLKISGFQVKEKNTRITKDIDNKTIILIDDVLHTGRTIRAAMNEIFDFGRPKKIILLVLIDRIDRELPINADFAAYKIDSNFKGNINLVESNGKLGLIIEK